MTDDTRTIGEILKEAREKQKLSLDEVSLLTKVKVKYLTAIEIDNWEALPSSVQQKGFLRSYAQALDVDSVALISQLRAIIHEDDKPSGDLSPTLPEPDKEAEPQPLGEIGSVLKTQRERLGFTIPNVENQIFIPERYLVAIENGNLEELPSTVQGKGMVKNYAQFLGLDPEPLLLNFADVLQKRLARSREGIPAVKAPSSLRIRLRRFLASPTILWVGVVILIGSVSIWAGAIMLRGGESSPGITATIPGVADVLLPTRTATVTLEALADTPGEIEVDLTPITGNGENLNGDTETTPTPGLTGTEKVQVQLIISQRTWVRVTVDNILAYEGRLVPGSVKLFGGELSIEVLTGNAAGVEIIYNQRDLGTMGLFGEVVDRVFTADGIVTPTPTITATPLPSATPDVTATPTPTSTQEVE